MGEPYISELRRRILLAKQHYGPIPCDRRTAEEMFHATYEDFTKAICEIVKKDHCKLTTYLEEEV